MAIADKSSFAIAEPDPPEKLQPAAPSNPCADQVLPVIVSTTFLLRFVVPEL